jgi:CRP-like cAMP-binding protein
MTNNIDFINRVPLFHGLKDRQLKNLARRFIPRTFRAGETIVQQGKGGAGMFILISGRAEAVLETSDNVEAVVNTFGPMDFFGEIALLDDGPRTASVIARDQTECLGLTRSDFLALMQNDADMGVIIAQELAKRMRRLISSI